MNNKTIPERVTTLETKFEIVVEKMAQQLEEIIDSLPEMARRVKDHHATYREHCDFIKNAEKETERIVAKEITNHRSDVEKVSKSALNWRKVGVIVSIVAQWGLILWIINKIYTI